MAKTMVRNRVEIEAVHKWDLTHLYSDDETWRRTFTSLRERIPETRAFRGRLADSPTVLADALDLFWALDKDITRLSCYASMASDEDMRTAGPQGMRQEVQRLYTDFREETAYVEPEILRMGEAKIEEFLKMEPRLEIYAFHLRDSIRRAAHTLSDAEEQILAAAMPLAYSPSNIFSILSNADFPYPDILLTDGRLVRVDQAGYAELRTAENREDRQRAMTAFMSALGSFSRTFGTTMNANVEKAMFYARSRRYASDLDALLDGPNVPRSVYLRLIEGVNRHLPTFHRYLRLRKRMLNISDDLYYYDLYAPLVSSVQLKYSPEEAQREVLAAFEPLGTEYVSVVERAFRERWIDLFPSEGKRSGAYSEGSAYDVHPYILMNYLGQYNDVSTLAHELGHAMHSFCSNKTQPYALANYHTFVAEVASITNETLLMNHVLRKVRDEATRLSLLGSYIETMRSTVFRQTQFAEFELRMHEMAEAGRPLTGESLSALYLEITRRYYGHDEGICVVNDEIAHEWSYIPHFYSPFYVFQYATSLTAAEALTEKLSADDRSAIDRYLQFLSSGTAKYPIDLLRDAGVDMTTDEPLELTMHKMNQVLDQMERLVQ